MRASQCTGAKLRIICESAKKSAEKFGGNGTNAYLCSVKPQVWLSGQNPELGAGPYRHRPVKELLRATLYLLYSFSNVLKKSLLSVELRLMGIDLLPL